MRSRSLISHALGFVLVAALPSAALAGGNDQEHSGKTDTDKSMNTAATSVSGTVQSVSRDQMTLKDAAGHTMKVELDKDTQFDNSGKTGSLSDLRPGMTVMVQGQKQNGALQANTIRYDKNAAAQPQQQR